MSLHTMTPATVSVLEGNTFVVSGRSGDIDGSRVLVEPALPEGVGYLALYGLNGRLDALSGDVPAAA